MAVKIRYQNFIDHPACAKLCLNCDKEDCDGICDAYKNKVREILGVHPLLLPDERPKRKPIHEKRPYYAKKSYDVNGESHTLTEWSRISGIAYNTLYMRMYRYGMTLAEAMGDPLKPIMHRALTITVNGESHTIKEWAEKIGVKRGCIYGRIKRGYTPEQAVTMERRQ